MSTGMNFKWTVSKEVCFENWPPVDYQWKLITNGAVSFFRNIFLDDGQAEFGRELRKIYGDFMWKRPITLSKMDDLKENEVNLLSYDRETGTKMEVTTTFKVCTELDKMDFYSFM